MAFDRETAAKMAEYTQQVEKLMAEARQYAIDNGLPTPVFAITPNADEDWQASSEYYGDDDDWYNSNC